MLQKIMLRLLKNTPIVLFVLIFIIFGLLSPKFFTYKNFENIATQASYIGIIAVGMTFVLLTGGIDLSVGAVMYLSASVAGVLMLNYGLPVGLALLITIVIGVSFGLLNSLLIVNLKIPPFIVTISTLIAGRGLTLLITKSQALPYPNSITGLASARLLGIPLPVVIFAGIVLVSYVFLKNTQIGRQIYAVGNDVEVAKKAGINRDRVLRIVYIISGGLAAIGGIVSVAQLGIVNPGFGKEVEFQAVAAAVLGGTSLFGGIGSVFPGTVIGTVLIQMIQAGLVYMQVDIYIQPLVQASIIFLAVFIDSIRKMQESKLERRNIRTES